MSSDRNIYKKVKEQAGRILGCLTDVAWKNKYIFVESKMKIYKMSVRSVLSYTADTRINTKKTNTIISNN